VTDRWFWLYWIVAFLGVCALLMIAAAIQEWLIWRRDRRRPPF
jgi:hypothetical protein